MAVTVDSVIVELDAKVDRYNADINRAHDNFAGKMTKIEAAGDRMGTGVNKSFGLVKSAALGFVGGLGAEAILGAISAGLEYAGSLGEIAQKLSVTTGFLQEFRFAATQNGASTDEADAALGKFSISLGKAFAGGKQAVGAFTSLGLSVADLAKQSETDRFYAVADAIAKIKDPTQQAAAAVSIFGKGALALLPTLAGGASGVRAFAAEAREMGLVLSDRQIQDADKTADKIAALHQAFSAKVAGVVADNASAIGTLANALAEFAGKALQATQRLSGFIALARSQGALAAIQTTLSDPEAVRRASTPKGLAQTNANAAVANYRTMRQRYVDDANPYNRRQLDDAMAGVRWSQVAVNQFRNQKPQPSPRIPRVGGDATVTPVSGGGGKAPAEPKEPKGPTGPTAAEIAEKAADVTRRFNDQLSRAQIDVIQALEGMAVEAVEQAQYQRDIRERQRKADVAAIEGTKEYSDARKATLIAEVNARATIDFDRINREENTKVAQEALNIAQAKLGNEVDLLQLQSGSARTAKQRRDVELRILAANYQKERNELEAVALSKTANNTDKLIAADKLKKLPQRQAAETANVNDRNLAPGMKYLDDLNQSADQVNEHIQSIAVNGLQSLNDGITDAIINGKSLSDVFSSIANSIIADLIRIAVQQAIIKPLANALFGGGESGGGGGFLSSIASVAGLFGGRRASGGNVSAGRMYPVNETGIEGFQPAQSGKIIPLGRMPNAATGGGTTIIQPLNFNLDGAVLTADLLAQMQGMAAQAGRAGALAGADLAGARAAMRAGRQL